QGKEALVLVPEISLTPQTIESFRGRCQNIAILHSHLHAAERGNHWRRIARGQVQVIVGARSAVFAPTRKLGLIVIDEEHEPSLERAMKNALGAGGQVMLLLNRRGYSTYLYCPACGHVEHCKFCDLSMTFHRDRNVTMCHYCGFENKPPEKCPICGMGQVLYQ